MIVIYLVIPSVIGLNAKLSIQHFTVVLPLFIYYGSFLLYSDIKDMKGDEKYGKRTIAVVLGLHKLLWLSASLGVSGSIVLAFILIQIMPDIHLFAFVVCIPAILQIYVAVNPHIVLDKRYASIIGYLLMTLLIGLTVMYRTS